PASRAPRRTWTPAPATVLPKPAARTATAGAQAASFRGSLLRHGLAIGLLAGLDMQVQPVFRRWQRAGGEQGEGARRVVGAVEIDHDVALRIRHRRIDEAAGAVAAVAAGAIGKDQEQRPFAFVQRL